VVSQIPTYLAASPGSNAAAGQVNQFLGAHNASIIYSGAAGNAQATGAGVFQSTSGTWLSQQIATVSGQTTLAYVLVQVSVVGGSPTLALVPSLSVALYSDVGGLPGVSLASASVSGQYVYSQPFWVTVPLAATGLSPSSTYHLVLAAAGTAGHYYTWQQSNQTSGAATGSDGVNWALGSFGFMYQLFQQGTGGQPQFLWEDSGQRWVQLSYNALGQLTGIAESTGSQAGGVFSSTRSLTYTNGLLTGVA
jgi:hypothetical protein